MYVVCYFQGILLQVYEELLVTMRTKKIINLKTPFKSISDFFSLTVCKMKAKRCA